MYLFFSLCYRPPNSNTKSRETAKTNTLEDDVVKNFLTLISIALVSLALTACSQDPAPQAAASAPTPAAAPAPAPMPAGGKAGGTSGTVVETMDAAGYTYVQVDNGTETIWAAAPKFAVTVGDSVVVPDGMAMNNYHSKTLDRDFPVVYFVDSVLNASGGVGGAAPEASQAMNGATMPEGHPPTGVSTSATDVDLSGISKADGGVTVGELFDGKTDLAGKEVTLRAKVVKFSPQIMGKNWIHIQDGSGDSTSGTNDLTVTTDISANVGDTVVVSGPVTLDKDFGYGYKYNVIIEDAKVTVE